MDDTTIMIAAPIVAGIVEAAKRSGLPTNYAGSAAIVFSFAITSLLVEDPTSREAAATAIVTGLTAAGLYSQARHYTEEFKELSA